jgi:hypothetical protein
MGRKKAKHREELFTHHIQAKVSEKIYNRLKQMLQNSDCHFMGELVRRILSREKITVYHKDASLDAPMEELIRIRKELNAIGVNINQITHSFHTSDTPGKQVFHSLKIAEEYKKVGEKVDILSKIIFELGQKWLQR